MLLLSKTISQMLLSFIWSIGNDFCRGHYAGVGGSGFQSFFLKDEIMKAISECGFEHPSEGIVILMCCDV